jgi:hypothetical protein
MGLPSTDTTKHRIDTLDTTPKHVHGLRVEEIDRITTRRYVGFLVSGNGQLTMIAARRVFTGPGARTGFQGNSANLILDNIWAWRGRE